MSRLILLVMAGLVALPVLIAGAALPESASVAKGVAYLRTVQEEDGGFGGFGPGQSWDAILAIRSAGIDPNTVTNNGVSPADFLEDTIEGQTIPNAAAGAKVALAARALSLNPASVAGVNVIAAINGGYDSATGRYGEDDFSQSLSMLGLACTSNHVPEGAIAALRETQLDDGGWGFGGFSDPDTASLAVQALLASGVAKTDPDVVAALSYLKSVQGTDGGWGFDPAESNSNSTAFVVQALLALGENPESATYTKAGVTPVAYLLSLQAADGSFAGFDPVFATVQVVPALAGRSYCQMATTQIVATPTPTPTQPPVTPTATQPPATATSAPATATRTSIPATATTRAPAPPNAGTGTSGDTGWNGVLVLAGLGLLAAGLGAAAATRRRR